MNYNVLMVIGIDGNEANVTNRVGVNKYAFEIIKGIYSLLPQNKDLIVWLYLKSKPLPDMPKESDQFKYKILPGGKVWILTKLMPHLFFSSDKPDVFFAPSHYAPLFTTMPKICAVMDLGYLEFSAQFKKRDYWQLKLWTAWSVNTSKYVLTISNATSKDIVRRYPDSKNKLVVTYPGYDEYLTTKKISATRVEAVRKKYSIVTDYILYLGTLKPSKNVEGLLTAFKELRKEKRNIQLVIAGKKGWLYNSIFEKVKKLELGNDVIFTDFVDEEDKAILIKDAKVFVLPSFWEGFGLDVLTAFALGVPVIASNVGSLPEVVGNAGILIDPNKTSLISSAILETLNMNKRDYAKLVTKEKMQLKKFSWNKAAHVTIETFRKAIDA